VWTNTTLTNRTLKIKKGTLGYDTTYKLKVTATSGLYSGSTELTINTKKSELVMKVNHAKGSVSTQNSLRLTAKNSKDPDELPGDINFTWTCAWPSDADCQDATGSTLVFPAATDNGATVRFAKNTLMGSKVYSFRVCGSKDTRGPTCKDMTITTKAAPAPKIEIKSVPDVVPTNLPLRIEMKEVSDSANIVTYFWKQTKGPSLVFPDNYQVALKYSYLVIKADVLEHGKEYGFELTASYADG
jgi:hypothetical protein